MNLNDGMTIFEFSENIPGPDPEMLLPGALKAEVLNRVGKVARGGEKV